MSFYNSKRNVFLMQFMIMTASVHTYLTVVWCGENMTVNFFLIFVLKSINFIEQSFRKIELQLYRKILAYLLCTTILIKLNELKYLDNIGTWYILEPE